VKPARTHSRDDFIADAAEKCARRKEIRREIWPEFFEFRRHCSRQFSLTAEKPIASHRSSYNIAKQDVGKKGPHEGSGGKTGGRAACGYI
jgi:hypothetical protein